MFPGSIPHALLDSARCAGSTDEMTPPRRQRIGDTPDEILVAAWGALDAGHLVQARDLAELVLIGARGKDPQVEARALVCLAHGSRIDSRMRRAAEESRRAAQLFGQLGDVDGEIQALITFSVVAVVLGRNAEAVQAALLAARLADNDPPRSQAMLAYNSLGLAYSWSGDHERGAAALEQAIVLAQRCEPPISAYQPRINQFFVEASRRVDERYETGALGDLTQLRAIADECRALERSGQGRAVLPGMQLFGRRIMSASYALLDAWQGDFAAAHDHLAAAQPTPGERPSWLDAFVQWDRAELAWAQQDWPAAEAALTAMRDVALEVEHEQFACRAQLLLVQVYERQGRYADAQQEQRALRRRERRHMIEELASREADVAWQLGARQSERRLQQVLVASRQFERWSLEDALTGIANRRHFEQVFDARLVAAVGERVPLTLAMIDVDRFKSVNDRHGHRVGDRVLKTLAAVMLTQLRERDFLARWAGDEFVALFDGADETVARQICERLRAAIAGFDWDSIAPGLRMSVSIGLSQAHGGDSAESVLQRSDELMYEAKTVD